MIKITVTDYKKDKYYIKIVKAVAILLADKDEISTIEILIRMGNLLPKDYERWLQGKIPYLENIFQGSLSKANRILSIIGFHMHDLNMLKYERKYKCLRNGNELRFSKRGIKKIDTNYMTHYKWNRNQEIKQKVLSDSLFKTEKMRPQKKINKCD